MLSSSETEFTFISSSIDNDKRLPYDIQVLKLALEKTITEYGPYKIVAAPRMSRDRAIVMMTQQRYPNAVKLFHPVRASEIDGISPIKFPIHLGLLGHRVCFVNEKKRNAFALVRKKSDLKNFVFGLGAGWADVDIMEQNGLNVVSVNNYDSLFKMTARGRVDVFCRGVHEVKGELEEYGNIDGLLLDSEIVIHYPLIVAFYTNAENKMAIERIQYGLHKSFTDGSLKALWSGEYKSSLDYINMESRNYIYLDSQDVEFDYRPYVYFDNLKSSYNW